MTSERGGLSRFMPWILGAALCGAVVTFAVRYSEEKQLVTLVRHASPLWLTLALLMQAATYAAQAAAWWMVARVGHARMSAGFAYALSLGKLFLDQALPSAGVSGTVVVAHAMEKREIPRPVVMAAVVVETVTYYAAYVFALVVALAVVASLGHMHVILLVAGIGFAAFGISVAAAFLALAGRTEPLHGRIARWKPVRRVLGLIGDADRGLAHRALLLSLGFFLQLSIVLLDAATVWACVRALGAHGSPIGIFASFMISALLRTVGVVPGGLGTFEAASVITLRLTGLPTAVALSATLLFRGLSFWLPMVPGLLVSRRLTR